MAKRYLFIPLVVIIIAFVSIFIHRYQILQYAAETLIRKNLPNYAKIDLIRFDFRKGSVLLSGFKILNPPGFSRDYLLEVERITCNYKIGADGFTGGLVLSEPVISNAVLTIERLYDGRLNLSEARSLIEQSPSAVPSTKSTTGNTSAGQAPESASKKAPGVKMPEIFTVRGAKVVFTDSMGRRQPHVLTLDYIDTDFTLKMDEYYSRILSIGSSGKGNVNGDMGQVVKWVVSMNPTAPRLTMANRFEVYNVQMPPFEPYYDRYSPIVFKAGRFSGLLIFDFDNGMIGSSNELHLSGLKFYIKQGYENAAFWETTVPDLVKYFTSPYGEIIFDFKIKGDMAEPKFYLGPKSKEAIFAMAVDKISDVIQKSRGEGSGTDLDKAQQYIDLFRGLMKK